MNRMNHMNRMNRNISGCVKNAKMILNDVGQMVADNWNGLPKRFPNIEMDEFIVMPNHMHGVITIVGAPLVGALNNDNGVDVSNDDMAKINNRTFVNGRAGTRPAPTALGEIIGAFKSITTDEYYSA